MAIAGKISIEIKIRDIERLEEAVKSVSQLQNPTLTLRIST